MSMVFLSICEPSVSVGHQVVDQARVPVGMAVYGTERGTVYDGLRPSSACDLMHDILRHFGVAKPREIIMYCDALAERLMHRTAQYIVQVRFPAQHERKAVQGVISMVRQHLYVIQDACGQVLRFIDRKEQRPAFFLVKAVYLFLYRLEHTGLASPGLHTEHSAELAVELQHADRRQADVFHLAKARVKPGSFRCGQSCRVGNVRRQKG